MEIDGRSPSLTWAYSKFSQPLRGSPFEKGQGLFVFLVEFLPDSLTERAKPCFPVSPVNEIHNDTVSNKGALGIPRGCRGILWNPPAGN